MYSFKRIFWILTLLLVVVAFMLGLLAVDEQGLLFYVAEALVVIILLLLYFFYKKVVKPIHILQSGLDLLREQDFSSRLKKVGQKETDQIIETFNRMQEQLKEERLHVREQNHFLDLLISVSPMGVVIMDFDNRITGMNRAAVHLLGMSSEAETKGKSFAELNTLLSDEILSIPKGETRTVRLSNSMVYKVSKLSFTDRGFAHPFILIESLTEDMMKAEKEAYEKVIRMMAHEVNNSVAGVTSMLDSVSMAMSEVEQNEEMVEMMNVCVERCLGLSNFITRFADVVKIPKPQFQVINLNEQIINNRYILENLCLNRHISLKLNLCSEELPVKMDAAMIEQVLLNIVKNAAESIGEGGSITITTTSSPCCVEIADTGAGISKELEQKIFSPFFTTKPNGQGIGLIFIREVLQRHGWCFSLRTYPDGLTRFKIDVPLVK